MVTDAARLLPSSSTPLEKALARTAPRGALDSLADAPARVRSRRDGALAPWLAAEWQLAEFAPYFASTGELIDAGLPWLRQRGTAAAVKRALSWIGFDTELELDGPLLHLNPGDVHAQRKLADVVHLARRSLPAHVQLYRMVHGHDLRPLRLDQSRLDGALLEDDSGVTIDGIKLSFGEVRRGLGGAPDGRPATARGATRIGVAAYEDRAILDTWLLDSVLMTDGRFMMGQLVTGIATDTAAQPPTLHAHRTVARSQAVPDNGSHALDDFNTHLGAAATIVLNPLRLDGGYLDSQDIERIHILIDEYAETPRKGQAPVYVAQSGGRVAQESRFTGTAARMYVPRNWDGAWDARPWRTRFPSNHLSENGA